MKHKTIFYIIIFFFLFYISSSTIVHNNFKSINEIGLMEQAIWNTINGNFMSSVSNNGNHFAMHNELIMIFISPIYYLFTNIFSIFIITNLFIVISAYPIYLIGKKYFKEFGGLAFAVSYLTFPGFFYSNIRSFLPIMLSVLFIGFAIYYMDEKKYPQMFIWLLLSLLTSETIGFLIIMFGILLYKNNSKLAIYLIIIGLAFFQISSQIVIPYFSPNNNYSVIEGLYGHLGTNIQQIIISIIKHPIESFYYGNPELKIIYLKSLFGHTLFTSIIQPQVFILSLPILMQNLFSSSGYKYDILAHYTYPLIPIIIYFSILGVKKLISLNMPSGLSKSKRTKIFLILILLSSIFSGINNGLLVIAQENCNLYSNNCQDTNDVIGNSLSENKPIIENYISIIPNNASVMAQYHTFSHLSERSETYLLTYFYDCSYAEYLLLDKHANIFPIQDIDNYLSKLVLMNYKLIEQENGIYLFQRTGRPICGYSQ